MNYSPAHVLAQWLIDEGHVVEEVESSEDWAIYVDHLPKEGDYVVTVYNTSGRITQRVRTEKRLEHPGIQIRIRAPTDTEGYDKAIALNDVLDLLVRVEVVLGESIYLIQSVTRTSSIMPLGEEEEGGRELFTTNFRMTVTLVE